MNDSIGTRNVKVGLVLLSLGIAGGLLMSTYAFQPMLPRVPQAFDDYRDLPRRLTRLAHVSAVMLPLLNVVLGPVLDRVELSARWRSASSWLLLAGAGLGPTALLVEASFADTRTLHLPALPFTAFAAGIWILAVGALRKPQIGGLPA